MLGKAINICFVIQMNGEKENVIVIYFILRINEKNSRGYLMILEVQLIEEETNIPQL